MSYNWLFAVSQLKWRTRKKFSEYSVSFFVWFFWFFICLVVSSGFGSFDLFYTVLAIKPNFSRQMQPSLLSPISFNRKCCWSICSVKWNWKFQKSSVTNDRRSAPSIETLTNGNTRNSTTNRSIDHKWESPLIAPIQFNRVILRSSNMSEAKLRAKKSSTSPITPFPSPPLPPVHQFVVKPYSFN